MAYQLEYTGAEVDRRLGLAGNIPTKVSDLTNDSGFVTKSVNDLVNYYLKSETYTKAQVESLIAAISQFRYVVVATLPTASADTMNKIYLVPSDNPETQNVKDEYITLENDGVYTWEQIGSTAIDLSDYVTFDDLNDALAAYIERLGVEAMGEIPVIAQDGGLAPSGITPKELSNLIAGDGITAHLVDTQSAGTEQNFTYRRSGGDGVANYKTIKGNTFVWEQLANIATATQNGMKLTNNGDGTFTLNGTASASCDFFIQLPTDRLNNKALLSIENLTYESEGTTKISIWSTITDFRTSGTKKVISTFPSAGSLDIIIGSGTSLTDYKIGVSLIDLTKTFGSGNEPATVAAFEELIAGNTWAPTTGTLKNNDALGVESVGFNLFDEIVESGAYSSVNGKKVESASGMALRSKNKVRVSPSTSYYFRISSTPAVSARMAFFDSAGNFISSITSFVNQTFTTPDGCKYLAFHWAYSSGAKTVFNKDICINVSDATRNGQYEPYTKRYLPLGLQTKTARKVARRVDYLRRPANVFAGINTGIVPDDNTSFEVSYKCSFQQYSAIISNYRSEARNVTRLITGSSENRALYNLNSLAGGGSLQDYPVADESRHTFYLSKTKRVLDGNTQALSFPTSGDENDNPLLLFINATSSSTPTNYVDIYYVKIWSGATLVRDFIPIELDGVGYMYDLVQKKLYHDVNNNDSRFNFGPHTGELFEAVQSDSFVPYSNGMNGVGTAFDDATRLGGTNRFGIVNLGDLTWEVFSTDTTNKKRFGTTLAIPAKYDSASSVPILICPRYTAASNENTYAASVYDKICATRSNGGILILDSGYTDATVFKSAMNGVYLIYELANPVAFLWETPLDLILPVDELGTEEAIQPAGTAPSAPFRTDTTYSISIANLVRKLNALSNE